MTIQDELAAAHAANSSAVSEKNTKQDHSREGERQTILQLKRIIENQKVEMARMKKIIEGLASELKKHKGSKTVSPRVPSSSSYETRSENKKDEQTELLKLKNEYSKLQKKCEELLTKNCALEVEQELAQSQAINYSCPHCNNQLSEMASQDADVLSQKLQQKIMLLEKAKSILSRSFFTEKHLRLKITDLKKRICELEGVPAISEENSASSQLESSY